MRFFRRKNDSGSAHEDHAQARHRVDVGYNPARESTLYWFTDEGYIIAHDVTSQHEYVEQRGCADCDGSLAVIAHLNRAGQGLSELVSAVCRECGTRAGFVFDISNDVFQGWWASQLGALYVQQYEGPPREPAEPNPLFEDVPDSVE